MNSGIDIAKGNLLVAEPFMNDPNFKRAVILLCDHHHSGSFGFILNKPIKMNVTDLVADFPDFKSEAFYGGPVQTNSLHYLHTLGNLLPDGQEVLPGLFWGGDYEQLKFLIDSGLVQDGQIRFYVGYSGWGAYQLEEELDSGSWIIAPGDVNYVFQKQAKNSLWTKALANLGDHYAVIGQMPDVMVLN